MSPDSGILDKSNSVRYGAPRNCSEHSIIFLYPTLIGEFFLLLVASFQGYKAEAKIRCEDQVLLEG